ncbi:MAG: 2OG-Fe dioxygenase family protein [Microcoleus vaginatus WJT46-NPBG5]|jgi:hypothetical protein|nr:2OG-Fe dioxygenase family protein [Microcoleus vaginatus WJT46-NPBG5]
MITVLGSPNLDYAISFALENINSIKLEAFKRFFAEMPVDPYIKGKYRSRRLSRFKISGNDLIKLPHGFFYQGKAYNPLLGDIKREFAELDDQLIALDELKKLVFEFSTYCKLPPDVDIAVHQIRISCTPSNFGNPAPEGIHRDGCNFVGIFAVDRHNILGGETHLYKAKKEKPLFNKILNPGELLLVNDNEFFHFTTPIKPIADGEGTRDVFVLTAPSLFTEE